MKIAVIPARGGSKRIPKKNIKLFYGRPMIAWAIAHALESGLFDRIIVSTDDEEIAAAARQWGAETPFVRPAHLADDLTPTVPVMAHAAQFCTDAGWDVQFLCCIYPCSPFLQAADLKSALDLLIDQSADFVYPVCEYAHPVQRSMRQLSNGQMQFLFAEHELTRTQDLEKTYHDTGQFYWGRTEAWKKQKKMHTDGLGMVIPAWRVVDIDNNADWLRAELLYPLINQ